MYKVLIVGAEHTNDYDMVERKCITILRNKAKTDGVMIYYVGDTFVEKFASKFGIDTRLFITDFKQYKNRAFTVRNEQIFSDCDAVIAFCSGYKDSDIAVMNAKEKGLPYRLIN